ncbi:MAG: hypothetical protein BJ554DRAFT_3020 [Olpidium bornovanus]|uniref:Uncharacterized protein n=1 Tax=Olpidium bornovanus TaxID=278681 RepID=A0A8H8A0R4_9FUNG|nr:MAG: hypothetical protein BJ554DRAFT_3020 [Olpidium bornovanus]
MLPTSAASDSPPPSLFDRRHAPRGSFSSDISVFSTAPGGKSARGGRYYRRIVPPVLKRIVRFRQMDFEFALWEMFYLCTAPRRVNEKPVVAGRPCVHGHPIVPVMLWVFNARRDKPPAGLYEQQAEETDRRFFAKRRFISSVRACVRPRDGGDIPDDALHGVCGLRVRGVPGRNGIVVRL